MYRRQQRKADMVNVDQQAFKQQETNSSPQEQLEAKDTQRMLSEALDLLKPRERQLFEMRQIESLSVEEVSEQTGIPKPSVIAMVSAARKKVFTELTRRMKQ
jgi:RNA polymerase sigma-70 factor (ECF subfamily)